MTELQIALQSATEFVATLPDAGTILRPAPNNEHILAARDGVFFHAVRVAILGIRATSFTADEFMEKTGRVFDAEKVDALYRAESTAEPCLAFADMVISQYGSAENFVRHL